MASEAPIYFSAKDLERIGITGLTPGKELAEREETLTRMPLSTQRFLIGSEAPVDPTEPNILTWKRRQPSTAPLTEAEERRLVAELSPYGIYLSDQEEIFLKPEMRTRRVSRFPEGS